MLDWFDSVNATFEFLGACFICLSVRRLWIDKDVKGVSVPHISFYAMWGWWNVLFYPAVGQWASFYAGILVLIVNMVWIAMMVYYKWIRPWIALMRFLAMMVEGALGVMQSLYRGSSSERRQRGEMARTSHLDPRVPHPRCRWPECGCANPCIGVTE